MEKIRDLKALPEIPDGDITATEDPVSRHRVGPGGQPDQQNRGKSGEEETLLTHLDLLVYGSVEDAPRLLRNAMTARLPSSVNARKASLEA